MGASVSIIIPNLNSPLIADVVESAWAQMCSSSAGEVIVCGLDELGLVAGTPARYVTVGKPLNAAAARNLGIREANGDRIVFLDSDCLPEPGWLDTLLDRLKDDRVVVSGAIRVVPDTLFRVAGNIASFHEFTTALPRRDRPFLASFSLALPRRAIDEVGWFDEGIPKSGGEDLDFTIRLRKAGYRLVFDPSAAVLHRHPRMSLKLLVRHAFQAGANSIRVRRRYPDAFAMPNYLFKWPILLASSPLLAAAVTIRAFNRNPDVRAHWHLVPFMLMSRLAWCLGACDELRHEASGRGQATLGN